MQDTFVPAQSLSIAGQSATLVNRDKIQVYSNHLNTKHLISKYFLSGFQTTIRNPDHLNTRLVQCSDGYCIMSFFNKPSPSLNLCRSSKVLAAAFMWQNMKGIKHAQKTWSAKI